jgi:hypothetical protein
MNIKVKQSNHKLLFSLFKPVLFKVLRPVIQKAVEKQVRDSVSKADAFLFQMKQEVDRVTEEAKNNPDPENIQNIYSRYFSAFQKQMSKAEQKKEAAKDKAKETSVNVAVTQNDSIFKNISLPGGISTKATEYQELAAKGENWESPVFSIGSAGRSKNLPAAAHPTRKPHAVTQGGLRGAGPAGGSGAVNNANDLAQRDNLPVINTSAGNTGSIPPVMGNTSYTAGLPVAGDKNVTNGAPGLSFSNQVDQSFQPSRGI